MKKMKIKFSKSNNLSVLSKSLKIALIAVKMAKEIMAFLLEIKGWD